jgi:hypothetical protein
MGILSNRSLIFLAEKVSIYKDMPFQPKEQKKEAGKLYQPNEDTQKS